MGFFDTVGLISFIVLIFLHEEIGNYFTIRAITQQAKLLPENKRQFFIETQLYEHNITSIDPRDQFEDDEDLDPMIPEDIGLKLNSVAEVSKDGQTYLHSWRIEP